MAYVSVIFAKVVIRAKKTNHLMKIFRVNKLVNNVPAKMLTQSPFGNSLNWGI